MALLLIALRLLRCNPLANRRMADPVRRTGRWRPRANALPTFFAVLALSGLVVVVTAGVAEAVGVNNGCTATLNGRDPAQLDSDHPLVVHKHGTVAFTGKAPASATNPKDPNNTHITVDIVEGIGGITSSDHPGHGPSWGGNVNVDNYLKYGVGLYHVSGNAAGTGWSCSGDAYVRLEDGNPLGKPIGAAAAALAVIGGAGAALSSRASADDASYDEPPILNTGSDEGDDEVWHAQRMIMGQDGGGELMAGLGCLILIVIAVGLSFLGKDLAAGAVGAVGAGGRPAKRRVWAHGHPVAGFISGLLAGIGITLLMQQFAVWPLTIVTAIAFPVVVALVCAIRAYLGRPFKPRPA